MNIFPVRPRWTKFDLLPVIGDTFNYRVIVPGIFLNCWAIVITTKFQF